MIDELPERDLLRGIDPARLLLVDERARADNLELVLRRVQTPETKRTPRTRRLGLMIAVPAGLAVATAALVVTQVVPAPSTPPPTNAQQSEFVVVRAGTVTRDGVEILANVTVGTTQFLLGRLGDETRIGVTFNGSDPDSNWSVVTPLSAMRADRVMTINASGFPAAGPGGVDSIVGQVGSDVTSAEIQTSKGTIVPATVANGFVIAAWAGETSDYSLVRGNYILHLADGTTSTVPFEDALPD
jgi:hypothetical protein